MAHSEFQASFTLNSFRLNPWSPQATRALSEAAQPWTPQFPLKTPFPVQSGAIEGSWLFLCSFWLVTVDPWMCPLGTAKGFPVSLSGLTRNPSSSHRTLCSLLISKSFFMRLILSLLNGSLILVNRLRFPQKVQFVVVVQLLHCCLRVSECSICAESLICPTINWACPCGSCEASSCDFCDEIFNVIWVCPGLFFTYHYRTQQSLSRTRPLSLK